MMFAPLRRSLQLLALLALLWQGVGLAAVSMAACCQDQLPCCLVATAQSSCQPCVPAAAAAGSAAMRVGGPIGRDSSPATGFVRFISRTRNDIWRPPQA